MRTEGFVAAACLVAGCASSAPSFTQISDTPAAAYEASLAPVANGFIAAWYDTRDGHGDIYARRLDADGQPLAPERRLTVGDANSYEADLAPLADGFVVGWYEKAQDGALTPKVGAFAFDGRARWVRTLARSGRNVVARAAGGLVFIAWIQDEANERASVWSAWLRSDGVDLIRPRRLAPAGTTTWNLNAAIDPTASPGNPRAWVTFDAKAGTTSEELFLVDTGETTDRVLRLTPDDGIASKYPDIAFAGTRTALTWFDMKDGNEEVYLAVGAKEAFARGALPDSARITSTPGRSSGAYLNWNGDRLGLAWCDDAAGNRELYFQSFDRDGRAQRPALRVTTTPASSSIPAIKPWKNGFALLWNEDEAAPGGGHGSDGHSQVMFTTIP